MVCGIRGAGGVVGCVMARASRAGAVVVGELDVLWRSRRLACGVSGCYCSDGIVGAGP